MAAAATVLLLAPGADAQVLYFGANVRVCLSHLGHCKYRSIGEPGQVSSRKSGDWSLPVSHAAGEQSGRAGAGGSYGATTFDLTLSSSGSADTPGNFAAWGLADAHTYYADTVRIGSDVLPPGTPVTLRVENLIDIALKMSGDAQGSDTSTDADRYVWYRFTLWGPQGDRPVDMTWCTRASGDGLPDPDCKLRMKHQDHELYVKDVEMRVGDQFAVDVESATQASVYASCSTRGEDERCSAIAGTSVRGPQKLASHRITITPMTDGVQVIGISGHDWSQGAGQDAR
ncbi:hypothetical protein ACS5PM_22450 [Ideonella sp. YS5]